MAAHRKGHRTEKEIAADEARKTWWTEERRKEKSEWKSAHLAWLNTTEEWKQKMYEGRRRSRGALR
jgi:hypothetical protein